MEQKAEDINMTKELIQNQIETRQIEIDSLKKDLENITSESARKTIRMKLSCLEDIQYRHKKQVKALDISERMNMEQVWIIAVSDMTEGKGSCLQQVTGTKDDIKQLLWIHIAHMREIANTVLYGAKSIADIKEVNGSLRAQIGCIPEDYIYYIATPLAFIPTYSDEDISAYFV